MYSKVDGGNGGGSGRRAEGTGKGKDIPNTIEAVSYGKVYPTRQLDVARDRYIIDKVKEYKSKLSNTLLKKDGNFAYADVDIQGINKKDFYSYSSLHKTSGNPNYEGFSVKPENPRFEATHAPDSAGVVYKRDADTEYKILNDIAERIEKLKSQGISVEGGKIKLFTEKDTCGSCSKIIKEFSEAYNIDIEVIHNGGKPIDIKN
ncbi:MAG: deaminase domain-containing protein [Paenibacillus dendritiformis]|uniref:deaminase domain-containing protein n=1 Tax=uncultured Paenibacillus sp. TaxID=227322 RepID=UPI0025FFCA63|nr:deaminase domain-containing protein [uncultured Paenibacillus sp.]MDU5146162.1 deaminase domain-containing protein [Paenibacillus dendritiformis]